MPAGPNQTPREGPLGVLSATGAMLYRDENGDVTDVIPGLEGDFLVLVDVGGGIVPDWRSSDQLPGIGYTLSFGANFPAVSQQGRWHHSHGEASSSNATSLDPTAELAAPKAGTITRMGYRVGPVATALTTYTIFVNGMAILAVPLTSIIGAGTGAAAGVEVGLVVAVAAGDRIAIQYTSGPEPDNSGVDLFYE